MTQYRLCSFGQGYAPDHVLDDSGMTAEPPDITYFVRSAFTGAPPPRLQALDGSSRMIHVPPMPWDPDDWPAEHVAARYWFVTAKVLTELDRFNANIARLGQVTSWGLRYDLIQFQTVLAPNDCMDLDRSVYKAFETADGFKIVHAVSSIVLDAGKLGPDIALFVMPIRNMMLHFLREDLAQALEDKGVRGIRMVTDFSQHACF